MPNAITIDEALPAMHARLDELTAGERRRAACQPGCDACCHHLVPVTPAEARQLRRRLTPAAIGRLRAARRQLESAGLLELLEDVASAPPDARSWLAAAYEDERVACPFLDGGQCSVYVDRPSACRVHFSDDAEACRSRRGTTLTPLRVRGRPATRALSELEHADWLPLICLETAPAAGDERRTGDGWLASLDG